MNRTVESRIHLGSVQPHLFSKLADISFEIDANEMLKQTEISDNHIDFINTSLEHKFALTEFGSRNFILVKNETTTDFFTSDDPVIRHLHSEISLRVYELFLPISPKFGIWIFPKGIFKELDEADQILYTFTDPQNIMFYNFLQVYRSTRQVFSFSSDFSYVEQLLKENPSFGNINKQRLH